MALMSLSNASPLPSVSFFALGLAPFAFGYKPFPDPEEPRYCDVPGSTQGEVHFGEARLEYLMSPSFFQRWFGNPTYPKDYLTFDSKDPREKFLFLSAHEGQHELLDPQNILNLLKEINKIFDLKYRVVKSVFDVCREVKEASQQGKLSNVFINAYGDSSGLCLSNCQSQQGWLHKFLDYKECFKGIIPNGKITLYGSKAGEYAEEKNIAQKIATDAKIQVIAPIDHVSPSGIRVSNNKGFEIYQKNSKNDKLFKSFQPVFERCTRVEKHSIHDREKKAIEVVKKQITENSQIIHPLDF